MKESGGDLWVASSADASRQQFWNVPYIRLSHGPPSHPCAGGLAARCLLALGVRMVATLRSSDSPMSHHLAGV